MATKRKRPYICCCGATAGRAVIFGYSADEPSSGEVVRLEKARMVIYWSSECNGLLGLASTGPKPGTRLSPAVSVTEAKCHEWAAVSPAAAKELSSWPA
jgi:hypothetical protein